EPSRSRHTPGAKASDWSPQVPIPCSCRSTTPPTTRRSASARCWRAPMPEEPPPMDTDLPRDVPTSILLATDMGARCDRARSRAVLLARQWNAKLVAITVVPSRQGGIRDEVLPPPAWARRASALEDAEVALQRDMAGCGMAAETRVGTGPVGPALLRAAEESGCGLIVTGSGDGSFLSSLPGSTIRWLSRHARQPVLVVRNRPRDAYRHLAFASDFSRPAQQAISLAAHWFGATVSSAALLHVADLPLPSMGSAASGR